MLKNKLLFVFLLLAVICFQRSTEDSEKVETNYQKLGQTEGKYRVQRQNQNQNTSIRTSSVKRRPPSLFGALNGLVAGTFVDTFRAYRNVTRLVNRAFAPPKPMPNDTMPANSTYIPLRGALTLLGRNYRGLRRLYDMEFAKAMNESSKNFLNFRKELKDSIQPFLEAGNAI